MEHTVVIGLDLSEGSILALRYAFDLTRGTDAKIHVVRCIEEETEDTVEEPPGRLDDANSARSNIDRIVGEVSAEPSTVSTHVVFSVSPATEICRLSDKINADLIVVGASGRDGSDCGFALGSCAEGVLRGAGRPVLVVRKPNTPTA